MKRTDNSHHLAAAAAQRSIDARRRTENALLALRSSGQKGTVAGLAKAAGVSRSWLYTQPDLLAGLPQLSGQRIARSAPATDRSLQVRLAAALGRNERLQQRVGILTEQNRQQRQQLELAYAEIRRLQAHNSVRTKSGMNGPAGGQ